MSPAPPRTLATPRSLATRRALLLSGGAVAAALAGCATRSGDDSGTTDDTDPAPEPTPEPTSPTARNRRTSGPVASDHPAVRWTYDITAGVRDAPAVADGTVYVGGWRPTEGTPTPGYEPGPAESLFALDAADGTARWRHQLRAPVQATPTVGPDGVAAVTGRYGLVHGRGFAVTALAPDGTRRWRFAPDLPYKSLTVVGIAAGRVFVGTADDALGSAGETLYALDAATGEVAWTDDVGDVGGGVAGGGTVYVAETGHVSAYDATSGRANWRVPGDTVADVTATETAVYVADDAVRALDPADGAERWRYAPAERLTTSAVAGGTVYVGTDGGRVVALDATDGSDRWRGTIDDAVWDLQPGGDAVYVGGRRAGAVALDAADGSQRWAVAGGGEAHVGPVVGDAVVVVGPDGRWLRSTAVADGRERWRFEPTGDPTAPVTAGGRVVVATDRGLVYGLGP